MLTAGGENEVTLCPSPINPPRQQDTTHKQPKYNKMNILSFPASYIQKFLSNRLPLIFQGELHQATQLQP